MTFETDDDTWARLDGFFKRVGTRLRDVRQRAPFAKYAVVFVDRSCRFIRLLRRESQCALSRFANGPYYRRGLPSSAAMNRGDGMVVL